ncbi:MAG: FHA domain-containing protein [Rhodospirillaceae bacterium]|nr:FHA domain-containing protein [Rhodospirillaceae bacterium]
MPIRRRSDGGIADEKTEVLPKGRPEGVAGDSPDGRGVEDSLFKPRPSDEQEVHLEAPTVPMGSRRSSDATKTRLVAPRKSRDSARSDTDDPMSDPPVGWLVVVQGPGRGRVLTVGNGMNAVGRGSGARVRIDFGDDTIARANHARLVYEPRQRRFLLDHGDGSNLTYLNGDVVMKPVEIQSGACIEIGNTTLRFQALCGKEFDWSDLDD